MIGQAAEVRSGRNTKERVSGEARLAVRRPRATPRGNSVATVAPPDAPDASGKARYFDASDAAERIWRRCASLRALWGDFPVVVRVHSGALEVPGNRWFLASPPGRFVAQAGGPWQRFGKAPRASTLPVFIALHDRRPGATATETTLPRDRPGVASWRRRRVPVPTGFVFTDDHWDQRQQISELARRPSG
jgi:hypothetical protein